jgi:hypothetical protein
MQPLNFPTCAFRYRRTAGQLSIFDEIRRKFVVLTPEEWVRQHAVRYLLTDKGYPKSLVNVEKRIHVNGLAKRYDIVVFNRDGSINILVECKAPGIAVSQSTFDQIARYNMTLDAALLMVTNGLQHYCCQMDFENQRYDFLRELPGYVSPEKAAP